MKYKIRSKSTGQIIEVEAASDQEALEKASSQVGAQTNSQANAQTVGGTAGPQKTTNEPGILEKFAPSITSFLGGVAGPIGTGAGYSIGKSAQTIAGQMRSGGTDLLAEMLGKSQGAKLTPYGQQRAKDLGYYGDVSATPEFLKRLSETGQKMSTQPEFSYGQAAKENITNPENIKKAVKSEKENLIESAVAGIADFAFSQASKAVLNKLLPKISPTFKAGGLKPQSVASNADDAAQDVWKPIQEGLKKGRESGGYIDVTDDIAKLEKRVFDIKTKFGGKLPSEATDEIAGIQGVIDDLKSASVNEAVKKPIEGVSSIAADGRPAHQAMLEEAMQAKDFEKIGNILDSIPEGDQYKQTMESVFRQYVPQKYYINPEAAQQIKSYFTRDTFSPVTKLGKVSSNAETNAAIIARKMVSPSIKKKIIGYLSENGVKNAEDLYNQYGVLTNLADVMRRNPAKGIEAAYLASFVSGGSSMLLGLPPQYSAAIGLSAFLMGTPIGKQVLREGAKLPFRVAPTAGRLTVPLTMEQLRGETQ